MYYNALTSLRTAIGASLSDEMSRRPQYDFTLSWISRERAAMVAAANQWVSVNKTGRYITMGEVEQLETRAVGHSDYAKKIVLYVAELVLKEGDPDAY